MLLEFHELATSGMSPDRIEKRSVRTSDILANGGRIWDFKGGCFTISPVLVSDYLHPVSLTTMSNAHACSSREKRSGLARISEVKCAFNEVCVSR